MALRIFKRLRELLDVDVSGVTDGDRLTWDETSGLWIPGSPTGGSGAPADVNYLVGTASVDLSAEIVVGTTPGGELGGTWASPTVDATHSGSSHATVQAAAEATAAAALSSHASDTTGVHGIADTSSLVLTGDSRLSDARTPTGSAGGVLGGTYPNPSFAADMATQAELDAHINDTSDAHDASAISIADAGNNFTATDVEAALAELHAASGGSGSPLLFAATATSDVTISSTTEASPTAVLSLGAQTYAAVPIVLDFFCSTLFISDPGIVIGELWADGTYLCRLFDFRSAGNNQAFAVNARFRLTPSAGSRTYEVRAFKATSTTVVLSGGAGTGGSSVYAPMLLTATLA